MPEDCTGASTPPEQPNKKLINLLGRTAIILVILMIGLVLAALGFLLYGLITAKLGGSIIGLVACVISFGLLFGVFRLVINIIRRQAPGQEEQLTAAMPTGKRLSKREMN